MISRDDKLIFPSHCHIEKISDVISDELIREESITNEYVVFNKILKSIFTINKSTKTILEYFIEPKTFLELSINLKLEEDNYQKVWEFIFSMYRRKFLCKEGDYEGLVKDKEIKSINGYDVQEVLKKGEYHIIFKTKDPDSGKVCVVKSLYNIDTISIEKLSHIQKEFLQEFETMDIFSNNPSVVNIKKYNDLYAQLEYVPGLNLKDYIREKDATLNIKLYLICQVIEVISAVHKKGIVHGDVHAKQFLVDVTGSIKLIDFGMSYNLSQRQNQIIKNGGVHYYMEPENINISAFSHINNYTPSFESEVYRLGILMYFVIYEDYPYNSCSWKNLCYQIKNEELSIEKLEEKGIEKWLILIIKKCLNKKPEKRFKSALELKDEFSKYYKKLEL